MLQRRNITVIACLWAACASAPPVEEPAPTPAVAKERALPAVELAAPPPLEQPAPPTAPDSPVVLRVSYGDLGTQVGSEWAVHADGAIRGRVCDEPRERTVSEADVAELRSSMERCKLCELPERHPSGANADKQVYRVEASWPDLSCKTDVSLQSRFHYDKRAQRCHDLLEALLHARVTSCPGQELAP